MDVEVGYVEVEGTGADCIEDWYPVVLAVDGRWPDSVGYADVLAVDGR